MICQPDIGCSLFFLIFLVGTVENNVVRSMRYSMTLLTFYSEEFFGSEISKSVKIRMKKKLWRTANACPSKESRGKKRKGKMTGKPSFLLVLSISFHSLSILLSRPCPSYHIYRVHLSRVDAHSPPTCYLSFHGNWVATVLHKYIL